MNDVLITIFNVAFNGTSYYYHHSLHKFIVDTTEQTNLVQSEEFNNVVMMNTRASIQFT